MTDDAAALAAALTREIEAIKECPHCGGESERDRGRIEALTWAISKVAALPVHPSVPPVTDDPDYFPNTDYERGYADGRLAAPPAQPAPDDTAALAAALRTEGAVRGIASRYGKFNDAYYDQFAKALLAALPVHPPDDAAALAAALKAAIPASIDENGDPIDEDRWFDSFAERLTEQAESAAYRAALPVHPPAPPDLVTAALALFDPMDHGSPVDPKFPHTPEMMCAPCVSVRSKRTQAIRRALVAAGALPSVGLREAAPPAPLPLGCTEDASAPGWCSTHLAWFHPRPAPLPLDVLTLLEDAVFVRDDFTKDTLLAGARVILATPEPTDGR